MNAMLLCELHAHTTWSDGALSLRELVDLYGTNGFDVLCVTDHAVPPGDPYLVGGRAVDPGTWDGYRTEIEAEGRRAAARYGLLLLAGIELSENGSDPDLLAHSVVLGIDELPPLEAGS